MATMLAAVMREFGPPEVLKIESIARPEPSSDQVLIRVRAFWASRTTTGHRAGPVFVLNHKAVLLFFRVASTIHHRYRLV
jgi:NADPH:quinone reductase-like Zn-dependent oxidoreductase